MPDLNSVKRYKIFEPYENLLAFTTTKQTFDIEAPRFTENFDSVYLENRKQLASLFDIQYKQLVFPRQTHSDCVAAISESPVEELSETDALVTDRKEICLCIQTADCVPILLFDPEKKIIAAVHAGWRGTVANIAEKAIRKMGNQFATSPKNIIAAIGPSIGPEVYEVGEEVIREAKENIPNPAKSIIQQPTGKYHFNLWEANRQILIHSGIKPENIEITKECSYREADKYYSARRDGSNTGRIVSGIMMI